MKARQLLCFWFLLSATAIFLLQLEQSFDAMHVPSEKMLSYMGLAEAGLWATSVNDGGQVVFVVKLGTDTLKWIHRGVSVNMLIGHVQVDAVLIRVLGLEVFDCKTNPLIPNMPQVEPWEVAEFDNLLGKNQFTVHFHNEQPFVSVLDATASLPQESIQAYRVKRAHLQFYTTPVLTPIFRKAQVAFEHAVVKGATPHVELFRFPLSIVNAIWNTTEAPEAGEFVPDDPIEGQSHEALLLHVLKPNFDGTVLASPKIPDGNKTRELCDVLALAGSAFLFEAKAFSVFDKSTDQTVERKAATVMKHFEKALGQLQGAARRIENGVDILADGSQGRSIAGNQFQTLHGIVAVSNTNFDLPWLEIGKQLADAQKPPRYYYHLLSLAEIQRMVAFAKGSPDTLNQMLIRRGEVIASSRDAHIQSDYIPEVSSVMKLTQVPGDCIGMRFVWVGEDAGDWLVPLFKLVYDQLRQRAFSGRLDFYHKIGMARGFPAIGIGLAAQSSSGSLGMEWWVDFRQALFQSIENAGLPQAAPNSEQIQTLKEITTQLPDLLFAVEFQDGFVVAKCAGEGI